MKIITWNVNGIRSAIKKGFYDFLKLENPDILCLQELKFDKEPEFSEEYEKYYNFSNKKGYSGVGILSKNKASETGKAINFHEFDSEGRFLRLDFPDFILINLYIPHGVRDKSKLDYKLKCFDNLLSYLEKIKDKKILLVGDFNVAHMEIDLANPKQNKNNIMFTQEERAVISKLIDLGFVDCFRHFNKDSQKFSWWPYYRQLRERNIGWRLDYIFASKNMVNEINKCEILTDVHCSDHCPVSIEMK